MQAYPDPLTPICLNTDTLGWAWGLCSARVERMEQEQVLGFASRTLTQPQMNYCVKPSVLLAVVFRVWNYQAYSAGAHFTIWTDHSALPWLVETKDNEGQMAQWIQM